MTFSTYVSIKVVLYLLALHPTPTGPHRDLNDIIYICKSKSGTVFTGSPPYTYWTSSRPLWHLNMIDINRTL